MPQLTVHGYVIFCAAHPTTQTHLFTKHKALLLRPLFGHGLSDSQLSHHPIGCNIMPIQNGKCPYDAFRRLKDIKLYRTWALLLPYIFVELSIERWPVTGSYTGITYNNMYCAICNGALQPVVKSENLDDFDSLKALKFWQMEIYCLTSIAELVEDEELIVTPVSLQELLQNGYVRSIIHGTGTLPL